MTDKLHPSHKTRISDASSFDEICTVCGATDRAGGGWGALALPCSGADTPNPDTPAVPEPVARYEEALQAIEHIAGTLGAEGDDDSRKCLIQCADEARRSFANPEVKG